MPTSLAKKYETLQKILPGIIEQNKRSLRYFQRKIVLQFIDPVITYNAAGFPIRLNLSHNLPIYQELCPLRDTNIARIAKAIKQKYKKLSLINVGANIGDSVLWVKSVTDAPALAIEGDNQYYPLLEENMKQFPNVTLVKEFVGEKNSHVKVNPYRDVAGSVRLDHSNTGIDISLKTLDTILTEQRAFLQAKYLMIDTDGYDNRVIIGAKKYLEKTHPVIFFEYEPECHRVVKEKGLRVFPFLKSVGYQYLAIYDNNSDFLISLSLDQMDHIEELHEYFSGRHGYRYMDIVAFGKQDKSIFESVVKQERAFFKKNRAF
jgi:FkbM family methyltransferase